MLGVKPGPMMIVHDLPLVWSLIWAIAISNLLCTIFLLVVGKHMSALAHIRASVLVPVVLVFALLGTYLAKDHWESLLVFAGMGAIGYVMRRNHWPRPCFIIGLVLGPTAEVSFHKAFALHGAGFLIQPTSLVMMAIIAITLTVNLRKTYRRKPASAAGEAGRAPPADGSVLPRG
jgi:putative tricarboxylic transport membrane protein